MAATPDDTSSVPSNNQNAPHDFAYLMRSLWNHFKKTLSLRDGIDRQATLEGIERDVEFKGHAAWILICSIIIASIGLGENNVAVIIGAMLISPLMGPILGIGLASATNDFDLLKKSFSNLAMAGVISVLIATLYFLLIRIPEPTLELINRKNATFLAIGVALFGGFAGIIAGSRPLKTNVFPGVAIATALMPPLCTVGYGLATWQMNYLLGASYLFFINSVFIALPTYLYIRFVRFPLKQFVDPVKERKIKRYIGVFLVVVAIPSITIFAHVFKESRFDRNSRDFIVDIKSELDTTDSYVNFTEMSYSDTLQSIRIGIGGVPLNAGQKEVFESGLADFSLSGCKVQWLDGQDLSLLIKDHFDSNESHKQSMQEALDLQHQELEHLRERLQGEQEKDMALEALYQEVTMFYSDVRDVKFGQVLDLDAAGKRDTVSTVMIWWKDSVPDERILEASDRLERWLPIQLKTAEVRLWHMNAGADSLNRVP